MIVTQGSHIDTVPAIRWVAMAVVTMGQDCTLF